jgi:hypothetical protein
MVLSVPEFFQELIFACVVSPVSPVVRRCCYNTVGKFNGLSASFADLDALWYSF